MNLNLQPMPAVITLIASAVSSTVSAAKSIHAAAKTAAELHPNVAHKVVTTIYADSLTVTKASGIAADDALSAQRNLRQQFAASLIAFQNAAMMIEITPPSADGKKGAVTVPASQLSPSMAKAKASEIMQRASEEKNAAEVAAKLASLDPVKRKEEEQAIAAKAKEAEAASKAKTAEIVKSANVETCNEFITHLSAILSIPDCRATLDAAFIAVGLTLAKCKPAPIGELATQLKALTK